MATERDDSLIDRIFDGRYLIIRKLGSGGMAEVYLAEDQELGRKVALKILNERHARDEQFVERFKREARNAAGLSHPHIVRIYDRGQAEGTYYIAMEYLDGPTLKELLVRRGPTPPLTAIKFAREILSALAEAHRHEIVHRDIKPHNVIVSSDWQIKVTDFGIARSGASQMTEVGSIVGTAQYLSPEQARGAPVDQRSDLYSLGIVLYEMLTGKVPFSGDAAVEIAMKHLTATPDPPSKLRPEIPRELDAVVMRALAKDPDDRYASAEEMDADLARVARGESLAPETEAAMTRVLDSPSASRAPTVVQPLLGTAPVPPTYRPPLTDREPARRRSFLPTLLGLLALAIAAAGGYLIYRQVQKSLTGPATVAVADVVDTTGSNGAQILESQGLVVSKHYGPSSSVPEYEVISQDPSSGTTVKKHSTVTILISTGVPMVAVPSIVGERLQQAEAKLAANDLTYKLTKANSSTVPAGSIISSTPPPGVQTQVHSQVVLSVSSGPQSVAVPNVVGQHYANAASALKGAGFTPVESLVASSAPSGQVVGESPSGQQPSGSTITVSVSKGPAMVKVTSTVGDDEQDAVQILEEEGFKVSVASQNVTAPDQNGLVLAQSPAGNAEAPDGSTVTISVGSLVIPATTPTSTTATTSTSTTSTSTTATTTTPTTTTATTTTAAGAPPTSP